MIAKFALVFILFTPDGSQYKDFVGIFATEAECQAKRAELHAELKRVVPDNFIFSTCVNPRPILAVDA